MTEALKPCCPCCGSENFVRYSITLWDGNKKDSGQRTCVKCSCRWDESRRAQPAQQSPVQPSCCEGLSTECQSLGRCLQQPPPPREQAAPLLADIAAAVDAAYKDCVRAVMPEIKHSHTPLHQVASAFLRLRTALAGYENEVIERCARVVESVYRDGSYEHPAAAIRAMKKEG